MTWVPTLSDTTAKAVKSGFEQNQLIPVGEKSITIEQNLSTKNHFRKKQEKTLSEKIFFVN